VVGGENALKSSEFISISGMAENGLRILFLFDSKQDILKLCEQHRFYQIVRFV
jgi:hypothetical protein